MTLDLPLLIGAFLVAVVVGLTGMGGGALMTPMMMLVFNVPPLAAVSSDLVASAVMKPIGGYVHLRRGTVNLRLVTWLCAGSVPAAFCGALATRAFGQDAAVQQAVKTALGVALLLAVTGMIAKTCLAARDREPLDQGQLTDITLRPLPTLLIGLAGGAVVGVSSVGAGSLVIVGLITLYPALKANQLVGTDLVQAVPLVIAAALGHLLFGDFHFDLTASLILGSIPGVYLGARISSRAPGGLIRALLALVLLASALKLLGMGTTATAWTLIAATAAGAVGWRLLRARAKAGESPADPPTQLRPGAQPATAPGTVLRAGQPAACRSRKV
ncbi:sulfite exporter TauE/SafE family protein [Spongiactinospora sp. 9N601]|uniref:sulfite exporter TauE/SafE family protein n=1 Tax=Spongiactinospora sp. 9N601 TaxID=3375149 RepID=UPI0037998965